MDIDECIKVHDPAYRPEVQKERNICAGGEVGNYNVFVLITKKVILFCMF